jgi:uncharacterized membrane protein
MLYNLIARSGEAGHRILEYVEYAALVIEILAVVIIVGAIFYAMGHYLIRSAIRPDDEEQYKKLKVRLGKALLLGLEILVAADIVRTVALEANPAERRRPGPSGAHPHLPELGAGGRDRGTLALAAGAQRRVSGGHPRLFQDIGIQDRVEGRSREVWQRLA